MVVQGFGHRHPKIQQALRQQMDCFEQIILANTVQEKQVTLCERLLAAANGYPASAWSSVGTDRALAGLVW